MEYAPTRDSLRSHPVPSWYEDAKLGIFVHWSVPSVPGFAPREWDIHQLARERFDDFLPLSPYTEWYENAIKFPWSPSAVHHREVYGGRPYSDFARDFVAGLEHWDPDGWAECFRATGAGYVVMVAKHHDGFCLWPSGVPNPHRPDWASPRDCVGDLARAVRARGMRFGVYYSGGIDWSFNTAPVRNFLEFVASIPGGDYPAYAEAQVRELVARVEPDVLWNDIAWPTDQDALFRLFVDYYRAVPEGLVNDRWITPGWLLRAARIGPVRAAMNMLLKRATRRGDSQLSPPAPPHYDTRTPEYAVFPDIRKRKWESVRGIDKSFGFNRCSREEDFLPERELIESFTDIVSKNGNLLLNVGPRGEDGVIPEPQLRRLGWLGSWLERNGEAIHGTRPWTRAEGRTREGLGVRFTRKRDAVYALLLGTPRGSCAIEGLAEAASGPDAAVSLLGGGPLAWKVDGDDLRVEVGDGLPEAPVHALRIRTGGQR